MSPDMLNIAREKIESNGYEPDDTLTRTHYGRHGQNGNRFDYISVGILGEKIVFNDSTILFIVPEDNDVQSEPLNKFKISNLRTRVEWTSKDIEAYTSNTNSSVSEVVVFKESYSTQPLPKNHLMVEKIIKVINDEGMEVEHVIGWRDGVQVEYDVTDDEFDGKAVSLINMGVDEGDLVLLALDTSNVIVGCRIAYDASAKSPGKYFSMNYTENGEDNGFYKAFDYYDEQSLRFGYVDTLLGGVASMSYTLGGEVKEMYPVPTVAATVYDESNKNNPIYKGGIGDIADYQSVDNDCSRIIVYASYAQWKSYYIYK